MVYQIHNSDIRIAAQVLGKSFIDYPVFTYILPNRTTRENKIEYLFMFLIKLGMMRGEAIAPSKDIEGVSIWIQSTSPRPSTIRVLWNCILSLALKIDPFSLYRFMKVGTFKEKKRKEFLQESYCLLDVIGIHPEFRNLGLARQMIETKLMECDTQSVPCYLETSNEANIAFYEKFHFQLIHKYPLFTTTVYCLLRKSQTRKPATA